MVCAVRQNRRLSVGSMPRKANLRIAPYMCVLWQTSLVNLSHWSAVDRRPTMSLIRFVRVCHHCMQLLLAVLLQRISCSSSGLSCREAVMTFAIWMKQNVAAEITTKYD